MKGGTAREGTKKGKVRKEMKDRSWADSERKEMERRAVNCEGRLLDED